MTDQGWFIGRNGEFLSWIPPYLRPCSPASPDYLTKFVITSGSCVDISDVVRGQEWQTIKDGTLYMS